MGLKAEDVFSDKETQHLILAYLYSRNQAASDEDIKAFLNACLEAVVVGQSVRMAADGLLLVQWDKDTGKFGFDLLAKARE